MEISKLEEMKLDVTANTFTTLTSRLYFSVMSMSGLAVITLWSALATLLVIITSCLFHLTNETCHWGFATFSESIATSISLFRNVPMASDIFFHKPAVCGSILLWNIIIRLFFNTVCAALLFRRLASSRRRFSTLKSSEAILIDYDQDGNLFISGSVIESRRSELLRVTANLYLVASDGCPRHLTTSSEGSLKTGLSVKHVIDWDSPLCPPELKMSLTCAVCGQSFKSSSDLIAHARSLVNSAHAKSYVATLQAAKVRVAALHRFVTGSRLQLFFIVSGVDQETGGYTQLLKTFKIPGDFNYRAKPKRYITRVGQVAKIDYAVFGKLACLLFSLISQE